MSTGDPSRRLPRLARAAPAWLPLRVRAGIHELRTRRIERADLERFRAFSGGLARSDDREPFFMFFTSGLLPWMARAVSFVPDDVNLVLLGSCLTLDEQQWIRRHVDRPLHHVELKIDDKTALEFLLATQEHDFGWVDVDCFVLNPELFSEMARIDDDVAINCAWSFTGGDGRDVILTYLTFFNTAVFRAVQERVPVSCSTYSYEICRGGRTTPYGFCKIPTRRLTELLRQELPAGDGGRPAYISQPDFYDTLQVYQIVAQSLGYRIAKVRELNSSDRLYSEELVHVGKVSYFKKWKDHEEPRDRMVYALLSQAEYVLLSHVPDLPDQYAQRRDEIATELRRLGLPTDLGALRAAVGQALATRGAPPSALGRILGEAPSAA